MVIFTRGSKVSTAQSDFFFFLLGALNVVLNELYFSSSSMPFAIGSLLVHSLQLLYVP